MSPRLRRLAWPAAGAATAALLAALAASLFRAYLGRPDLDHGVHLAYVQRLIADGALQPHFLYHLLVAAASGFSRDYGRLALAANAVLTLLVLARVALALQLIRSLAAAAASPLGRAPALALGVAFFFVAPLPNPWQPTGVYLGQLSPTVWHSPTAILLAPLALAAFRALVLPGPARDGRAGLLLALSTLAKPNFALAFAPAACLLRLRRPRPLAPAALLAPTLLVLAWQWQHARAIARALEPRGGGLLALEPLLVWRAYSPSPLFSALLSLAFPLAVLAAAGRGLRHRGPLAAAWLVALFAIAEFALLAEPGQRLWDANYYWGVVPALFILFVVSAAELLAAHSGGRLAAAGRRAAWVLLAAHAASGVVVWARPYQIAVVN